LLIVIGVRLFYKNQIKKINKTNQFLLEKIELEKNLNKSTLKAIKSQMNPHFFYNALNTIQSYILSNDKKMALNYLSKFSTLTRTILEMSEKEYIGLAEEIKTINLYLEIEQARFNEDFEYAIEYENLSELEPLKIPSMLLQPYIENAIKHGLLHKVGPKKLIISFVKNKKTLQIKIDDNGIGRQKSSELNSIKSKKHQSFATEAMQNRIDLLNKNKSKKISINYIDKINENQQSTGTTVIIEIPIN
jgi:LytS/YehU family sensor histidine kinase